MNINNKMILGGIFAFISGIGSLGNINVDFMRFIILALVCIVSVLIFFWGLSDIKKD